MDRYDQGWRAAGLLLHVTYLPGPYGVGDLGPEAHAFLEVAAKAGLHYWQVLPINPTAPALGNSPYSAFSAFAGHELLISPDLMAEDGWLDASEVQSAKAPSSGQVDFQKAIALKSALIDAAFEKVGLGLLDRPDFARFIYENASWLNDYSFFMAVKGDLGGAPWTDWPEGLRRRDDHELAEHGRRLSTAILRVKFGQYLFFKQLGLLKDKARWLGVGLIGDTAFYVNHDSSDVWANPSLFSLKPDGSTDIMAGVPPDYYSEDGQLWGNPVFNWPAHQADGFAWWTRRIGHNLGLFDWVRLDHFRAFSGFWAVEPGSKTARRGSWMRGPGKALFEAAGAGKELNIIAEDLGIITPDVTELRKRFAFPGMRVLHFGFGDDQPLSLHTPFRVEPDNLIYSSTHDSNTTKGWFQAELDQAGRKRLSELAGYEVTENNASWALVRLAWLSAGALCACTTQDLLGEGSDRRLNVPGTAEGNWGYRLLSLEAFTPELIDRLAELTALSGRDNLLHPNVLTYDS
jgi:4-alpha-glucanotransferase